MSTIQTNRAGREDGWASWLYAVVEHESEAMSLSGADEKERTGVQMRGDSAAESSGSARGSVGSYLILDSGVGGLSVLEEILVRRPGIPMIYLFDNAFYPYGEKSAAQLMARLVQLVERAKARAPIAGLILACNSASSLGTARIARAVGIPVAGIYPDLSELTGEQGAYATVLATSLTLHRLEAVRAALPCGGQARFAFLNAQPLTEIAEQYRRTGAFEVNELKHIISRWEARIRAQTTCLLLGCTHFIVLRAALLPHFPAVTQVLDGVPALLENVDSMIDRCTSFRAVEEGESVSRIAYCTAWTAQARALASWFAARRMPLALL